VVQWGKLGRQPESAWIPLVTAELSTPLIRIQLKSLNPERLWKVCLDRPGLPLVCQLPAGSKLLLCRRRHLLDIGTPQPSHLDLVVILFVFGMRIPANRLENHTVGGFQDKTIYLGQSLGKHVVVKVVSRCWSKHSTHLVSDGRFFLMSGGILSVA
jgi:hypothetical protein